MPATTRRILITSALPYANGPIHLGHLVEYIQTDIWARFQRLRGHETYYICADDAHGSPIMLRAEKEGITPKQLIDKTQREHQHDFSRFLIEFDHYHSTHSPENQQLVEQIYTTLNQQGYILKKTISQAYDAEKQIFLPDRYVKGTCPNCHTPEQYGDNCEACGATYSPLDLINPYSVLSNTPPEERQSEHYFFNLPQFESFLKQRLETADIQESMRNKLAEWFNEGLQAWDISRDAPYWGFNIPEEKDKYFYVWLDAPIGYMASFKALCAKENLNFDDFWHKDSTTELYHFIGKDIAYFHTLFWTAMLHASNHRQPTGIYCHGFLTVNGEKMSKSRGTFIKADTYLKHLRPEYLRYYFAAKLSAKVEDLDLNLEDFRQRINSDLVGKLVNLASRNAPFIHKHFDSKLSAQLPDSPLLAHLQSERQAIAELYEKREYSHAVRKIMQLTDRANEYIDQQKPWVKIKNPKDKASVQEIATIALNAFYQLIILLKPILPQLAQDAEAFLQTQPLQWQDLEKPLINQTLAPYQPLMQRIEPQQIDSIIKDSKEDMQQENQLNSTTNQANQASSTPPTEESAHINIEDFAKIDLRLAKIVRAEAVEGADKLLSLTLDVGELGQRHVFAGIKNHYQPQDLEGQLVAYIANLKPRKMRFGLSEGMVLAAGDGQTLHLLNPNGEQAKAGMKIR